MLPDLYAHMEWADAMVWRAVLASDAARNDKRVRDLLAHLHMTQRAFLSTWRKEPLAYRDAGSFAHADEVLRSARQYYAALGPLPQDSDDLDRPMVMPWAQRYSNGAQATTFRETLLQVPMHSTYHRGQVNARIREVGGKPPLVDYIAWLWLGRPPAEWPET